MNVQYPPDMLHRIKRGMITFIMSQFVWKNVLNFTMCQETKRSHKFFITRHTYSQ